MLTDKAAFYFNKIKTQVDLPLLAFLILFLNVKLAVKVPAIILIYALRFNFNFGFKFKNSRLPLFYPIVIFTALTAMLINQSYSSVNYLMVFLTGVIFWLLCILAIHQVKLSVERNETEIIHNTLTAFFFINAVISLFNIALIIKEIGAINPYTYQGQFQKYFLSTGDYIKGLTFDISTTNSVLSAFGVVYFLTRKNAPMLFICMLTMLLTGSNFINLVLLVVFLFLFVFRTNRYQKSLIVVCLAFLIVFMAKISPENNNYTRETFINLFNKKPNDHQVPKVATTNAPSKEERRQRFALHRIDTTYKVALLSGKIKPPQKPDIDLKIPRIHGGKIVITGPDINSAEYQSNIKTLPEQKPLISFINAHHTQLPVIDKTPISLTPGKITALLQTLNFYRSHISKIVAGAGIGNFSSKLAFKATGLGFAGGYPQKFIYINPAFMANHLHVYLNYFSKRAAFHSLTNSPYSVYDQLLAEYGLIGLLAFTVYYLGFFVKNYKKLTYGIPVLLIMMAAFFVDYWFEQLSVIIVFELLLLLNIKEYPTLKQPHNEF